MSNLFIKVDNINGESQDADHKGWTDIHSYSWGVNRVQAGKGGANHLNLIAQASMDKSTPAMFLHASNGHKISKVQLSACKAGGNALEYYRITLENVFIAGVSFSDGGDDARMQYAFQAETVKVQYWEQSASGGKGAEARSGWDIKNNTSAF